ncbi:glycerophosphodiester phosphodiesterase family protein [Paenibacillus sp. JX-17]|uniref:Glycerophosphodiester phosphodiesterase family protein n=1 Tax=Paenibacillus lacisoli TaxID=3064525 RepID=A0ABT9CAX7_9BACL|nr:glycerophosphodiester phosphodiesterase family protein [Paenibacillus sp. JX-17]MDO7906397.1 glycerophosphodiester phosphodiesterase family protein [Paenibacillus sp. JX-17]
MNQKVTSLLMAAAIGAAVTAGAAGADTAAIWTIAHRGAAGYAPENTAAAFDMAVHMKADLLELDVQLSRDGELVVIHDLSVDRTTNGKGEVRDMTLRELQALDAGSWYGPDYRGQRILSLTDFLTRYARTGVGYLIEIKEPSLYPGIEQRLAQELEVHGLTRSGAPPVIVQSFDLESLVRFKQFLPFIPVGLLTYDDRDLDSDRLRRLARTVEYVNPHLALVTEEAIRKIRQYHLKTMVWTVREPNQAELLLAYRVDGIITDYPDYVLWRSSSFETEQKENSLRSGPKGINVDVRFN